jgi:hypothetical protein
MPEKKRPRRRTASPRRQDQELKVASVTVWDDPYEPPTSEQREALRWFYGRVQEELARKRAEHPADGPCCPQPHALADWQTCPTCTAAMDNARRAHRQRLAASDTVHFQVQVTQDSAMRQYHATVVREGLTDTLLYTTPARLDRAEVRALAAAWMQGYLHPPSAPEEPQP